MQEGLKTRYTIYLILKILKIRSVDFNEIFLEKVISKDFSISDRKMIHNVVLNTMRFHLYVDKIIKIFSKKIDKSSDNYFLLLSAVTQLLVLNFKDFAVINSTVELTKDKRVKASTKFINGILRNINKNRTNLSKLKYSFSQLPFWFTKRVLFWSKKEKEKFVKTICEEPDLHIVFKNKNDIKKIKNNYIQTSDRSIAIKKSVSIKEIDGYSDGLWWVQDFSIMLPLYLTNNIKNKTVADLCAAPGGKSFQLINYGAKVKAIENNYKRAELMKKNLFRLKLECQLEVKDILKMNEEKKFDLVVLDAPCSSIGTVRRHPEIFYRKSVPDFKKIISYQEKLLEKAKTLLKINGILIYMVCSFFKEEGEKQIYKFLKKNKDFSLIKYTSRDNMHLRLIDKNGFYNAVPLKLKNDVLIDGFFAAKLRKND